MLLVKMLRDLQQNITQFLAIFVMSAISLIVASGTGVSGYTGIDRYMEETNFKDLDLSGVEFTKDDVDSIFFMPEVRAVDGYYNTNGKMELSEDVKVLISYITSNDVSKLHIAEGEPYAPGEAGVWVDARIAEAKGIQVGDTLDIYSEDARFSEKVRGLCYSPQYLYYVVDSSYAEPDYSQFGFLIMDISRYPGENVYYDELLVDLEGVQGDRILSKEDKHIISKTKQRIRAYVDNPALVINDKSEDFQIKNYIQAIDSNIILQTVFPTIFGSIALLGILTTMTRLIARQRTTIGALKALGFTSMVITLHYMSYSLIIVFLGCVLGSIIGFYTIGPIMYDSMIYYYLMPYESMEVSSVTFIASAILLISAALVAYFSNAKVLNLSASQILQPEAPKSAGKSWYESLSFWKKIKFATQWNIRDISRNAFRTVMSVLGVMVCSSLVFSAFGFLECINHQGVWLYQEQVKACNKVEFASGTEYSCVYDYAQEYKGQMLQSSAIRLYADNVNRNSNLYVVDHGTNFFMQDMDGNYVKLPQKGLAMTKTIMDLTGIKIGDTVSFNLLGEKDVYTGKVTAVVRTLMSQGIYMTKEQYEEMRGSFTPNILYTSVYIPKKLEERSEIASVNTTGELLQGVENGNESYRVVVTIMIILAVVLGSVILYNLGSMSYNEKLKDMATLKVLGFRSKDLKHILTQQNLIVTGLGSILGIPLGFTMIDLLTAMFGEEADCLVNLSPIPYIANILFTFVLSIIINRVIVSKLEDINMVEALK